MAKTSMIERDKKRQWLAKKFKVRRTRLKARAEDQCFRWRSVSRRG